MSLYVTVFGGCLFVLPPLYKILNSWIAVSSFEDLLQRHLRCTSTKVEGKAIPVEAYYRTIMFWRVEASRFLDNLHMKVAKLSVLRTGRLYSPGNIPGTHFC